MRSRHPPSRVSLGNPLNLAHRLRSNHRWWVVLFFAVSLCLGGEAVLRCLFPIIVVEIVDVATVSTRCPLAVSPLSPLRDGGCRALPETLAIDVTSNGEALAVRMRNGERMQRLSVFDGDDGDAAVMLVEVEACDGVARGVYVGGRRTLRRLALHLEEGDGGDGERLSQCTLVGKQRVACQRCAAAGQCRAAVFDADSGARVRLPARVSAASGEVALAAPVPEGEWAVVSDFALSVRVVTKSPWGGIDLPLAIPRHLERLSADASLRCVAASPNGTEMALVLTSGDGGCSHGVVLMGLVGLRRKRRWSGIGFTTQDPLPRGAVATGCQLASSGRLSIAFVGDGGGGVVHVPRSSLADTVELSGAFSSLVLIAQHKFGFFETRALQETLENAGVPVWLCENIDKQCMKLATTIGAIAQVRNLHSAVASAYAYHVTPHCEEFSKEKLARFVDRETAPRKTIFLDFPALLYNCCSSSLDAWRQTHTVDEGMRVCDMLRELPLADVVSGMAYLEASAARHTTAMMAAHRGSKRVLLVRFEDSMSEDVARRRHFVQQVAQFAGLGARSQAIVQRHVDSNVVHVQEVARKGTDGHIDVASNKHGPHRWSALYERLRNTSGEWERYEKYARGMGLWELNEQLGYDNRL